MYNSRGIAFENYHEIRKDKSCREDSCTDICYVKIIVEMINLVFCLPGHVGRKEGQ